MVLKIKRVPSIVLSCFISILILGIFTINSYATYYQIHLPDYITMETIQAELGLTMDANYPYVFIIGVPSATGLDNIRVYESDTPLIISSVVQVTESGRDKVTYYSENDCYSQKYNYDDTTGLYTPVNSRSYYNGTYDFIEYIDTYGDDTGEHYGELFSQVIANHVVNDADGNVLYTNIVYSDAYMNILPQTSPNRMTIYLGDVDSSVTGYAIRAYSWDNYVDALLNSSTIVEDWTDGSDSYNFYFEEVNGYSATRDTTIDIELYADGILVQTLVEQWQGTETTTDSESTSDKFTYNVYPTYITVTSNLESYENAYITVNDYFAEGVLNQIAIGSDKVNLPKGQAVPIEVAPDFVYLEDYVIKVYNKEFLFNVLDPLDSLNPKKKLGQYDFTFGTTSGNAQDNDIDPDWVYVPPIIVDGEWDAEEGLQSALEEIQNVNQIAGDGIPVIKALVTALPDAFNQQLGIILGLTAIVFVIKFVFGRG